MEHQTSNREITTRTYFLEQGKQIHRLYDMLDNGVITGYLKRGISILLEIILFVMFLGMVLLTIYIPLDPVKIHQQLTETSSAETTYHNDDVTAVMMAIKLLLFVSSLVPLALMIVLGRNRRKNAQINLAFEEVEKMKESFDKAVKELHL